MRKIGSASLWGVYSVWRRHSRVYAQSLFVNCIAPVSEPVLYLIAFGYGLSPLVGSVHYQGKAIDYQSFIAPGMIAVGVLFQSFFEGGYGSFVRLKFQRTWHGLLTAPLSFMDVFLGDLLWAATKGTVAGVITGLVGVIWGILSFKTLLMLLPCIVLGGILFGALGLLTAGLVRTVDQINIPVFLLIVPMFTLCGTYFPRDTLPLPLQIIASILPLASFVDVLRWEFGTPDFWLVKILWLAVLTGACGVLAARFMKRQLFSA